MTAAMKARLAAATLAAALTACHPASLGKGRNRADRRVSVAARLVCPPRQGRLDRALTASDGRSCRYTGPDQRVVELKLLALDDRGAADALRPVEAALRVQLGTPTLDAGDADGATPLEPGTHEHRHDHVSINLPGVHIDADDAGAHVQALGRTIEATQRGGATMTGDWNGSSNTIKATERDVEMRLGFAGRAAVDLTWLLNSAQAGASGKSLVGYVARGPALGPLVLATVVANPASSHGRNDFDLKDIRALVAANLVP